MDMRYDQISPVPPLTKITRMLIIVTVAAYLIDFVLTNLGFSIFGRQLISIFGLVPQAVHNNGWVWQFVTYMFMHGPPLHLLMNMLLLWYFGAEIELRLGEKQFLFYYFLCGIGAGLFNYAINILFTSPSHWDSPIIGASGAIYGILAAYGIFFGNRYFLVFFLFPMKARYFVMLMAAMELIFGAQASPEDNVAHFAHVGGIFVGALYIYLRYVRAPRSGRKQSRRDYERERLKKQFTLIVNQSKEENQEKDQNDNGGPTYWN